MDSDKELEEIDFIIMTLVRNGVQKVFTITKQLPIKIHGGKINDSINKLERLGHLEMDKSEGWISRKINPKLILKYSGMKLVEDKIEEMKDNWDLLVKHYEAEEKEPLRKKMNGMKGMFPMMFTMGIVNGAMISQMLHMNHMNVINYFIDQPILIDYLNDPSEEPYTDGSGGGDS
jgi:hypothetical protein